MSRKRCENWLFQKIFLTDTKGHYLPLPIVNESGGLIGTLTSDDLLRLLSKALLKLSKLVRNEQQKTRSRH
ncbi:hypothetical protein NTGM5_760023 [Candidatus Nitrotoga sp. M5]|nr:hypothetical protein NTGM5_760023 [Candidatus Nitrotoga sp. M5]